MSAILSPCGRYRYRLERELVYPKGHPGGVPSFGPLVWIMLNPSIADAEVDDPTIRRVCAFSRIYGHTRAIVVNLFALRATDPRVCEAAAKADLAYAVGPDNDQHILAAAREAKYIVCAWGAPPWAVERAQEVCGMFDDLDHGPQGVSLGTTKSGAPRHPLYVPHRQPLVPFHGYTRAVAS